MMYINDNHNHNMVLFFHKLQGNLMRLILTLLLLLHVTLDASQKLVIAGPFASVSHPILEMVKTNALKDLSVEIEFRLWKNPDELRALVITGDVDMVALPTNTAAILYNKGVDIQLISVSTWGILGMISRDPTLKTLKDFKGKEIIVPFRADMPDIVFTELLKAQGMDPKKDFDLKYVASPIDAMQMLILRRADHVLLAEPAISVALRKTKSFPIRIIAPDLHRSADLQEEWAKTFHTSVDVPQAGIAVLGELKNNKVLINRFLQEYEKAIAWYKANPEKAGDLVAEEIDMLSSEGVMDSIAYVNLKNVSAIDSREKLEFFFEVLKKGNPKSIGKKLPDDGFYYRAK